MTMLNLSAIEQEEADRRADRMKEREILQGRIVALEDALASVIRWRNAVEVCAPEISACVAAMDRAKDVLEATVRARQ